MKIKNPTLQKTVKVATIAGAAVIVVNSAMKLVGVKSAKEAVMPVVSILVGIAAFNYAMTAKTDEVSIKA
jgi:hypothetical protein